MCIRDSMEILSTFHARVEYISYTPLKPLGQWGKRLQNPPLPWGTGYPSNTWMPGVTPLTIPNDSSITARTFAQLRNKLYWLQWDAPHPKNFPFPSTTTTPSNTPIPQPTPFITLNDIRIQSAVLPQCTLRTDRPIDRPTDRRSRRMFRGTVTWALHSLCWSRATR